MTCTREVRKAYYKRTDLTFAKEFHSQVLKFRIFYSNAKTNKNTRKFDLKSRDCK